MADVEIKSKRLQVATMRPDDSGRGIARLPRAVMAELGLAEGDVIELVGKRTTPARAVGPYPEDEGLEIIRLDGLQRANAEIGSGDFVTVRKAESKAAQRVVFAPAQKNLRLHGSAQALTRSFGMKPLTAGDVVATTGQQQVQRGDIPPELRQMLHAPAYALQEIRLTVLSTGPKGIVHIDANT
ncbi:MAG: transitional endoplasmic reticulum ATPase, partial [Sphingomonadales bacterium]|nr:transitional endoplasmic reticulum ATPase [Sphingomonadales bacterium]